MQNKKRIEKNSSKFNWQEYENWKCIHFKMIEGTKKADFSFFQVFSI